MTGIEVEYISREVESGLMDLVLEMEMEYCLDEEITSHNPSGNLAYALLSHYAQIEGGTRSMLAKYLRSAGFFTTSRRFILFVYWYNYSFRIYTSIIQTSQGENHATNSSCFQGLMCKLILWYILA